MYNFGYKFRAGVSLDGVYDGSANVIPADPISDGVPSRDRDRRPVLHSTDRTRRLGPRREFVMPYFNIGIGLCEASCTKAATCARSIRFWP